MRHSPAICLIQGMGIARLRLLVACILWVMCWSERKANGQQGVGLTLNGTTLPNNSIVVMTDIGTGAAALACATNHTSCCTASNPNTQWYFPNGSRVLNSSNLPYYQTRNNPFFAERTVPPSVLLHRNPEGTTTGIFHCDIPDASGVLQNLFVGIYTSTTGGQVRITGVINFQLETHSIIDPPVFTLTCTSTGGPATTVSWTRGSNTVTADSTHIMTSWVTDTVVATYVHALRVTGRQVGSYRCSVSNSRTSPAAATTLQVEAAGQPGNLGAVTSGPTSIRITWAAPTSGATVTGYRIYWNGGSDQGSMDANAGDTAVTITGRSHGLVYTITIVALSNVLPSQTVMVTVTLAPSPPTVGNALSPTSIALVWIPVPGELVHSYEITFSYRGPCSGITLTNTTTVGATSRSHTQTGLQGFSNYIVSVAAVNSGGRGTQTQMITTMSSAPSGAPQMVAATATGRTTISVQWERVDCLQRNSDITGYVVSYGRRGNESDTETETVQGTTDRTYTMMGLSTSTEYFVMVAAMNSDGVTGPFSNPVYEETLSVEPPPTTPTVPTTAIPPLGAATLSSDCVAQAVESASLAGAVVGACIGTALLYTVVLLVVIFALVHRNKRHSTDMEMKECVAYGGVTVHSGMEEGIYEDPQ